MNIKRAILPLINVGILLGLFTVVLAQNRELAQLADQVAANSTMGTAFTYQGLLHSGGGLADGTFDLQFRLYDAASGGSQVGSTVTLDDVAVSDGLFTVSLDFGANVLGGSPRWLAISVRPGSGGSYETLSPRQPLNPTPYALHAWSAGELKAEMAIPAVITATASTGGGLPSGTYYFKIVATDGVGATRASAEISCTVDGVTTDRCALAWEAVPGAAAYRVYKGASSQGQDRYQSSSSNSYNYDGDGGATLGAVPTITTAYVNSINPEGDSWLLSGNLGLGTTNPSATLHLFGDRTALYGPNSGWGGYLQVGGSGYSPDRASISTSDGTLYLDDKDGASGTFINYYSQNNTLVNVQGGNVGIGTINPTAKLDVAGNLNFDGQKACQVSVPGTYTFFLLIPASWTSSTCNSLRSTVSASEFRLACVFADSFSRGTAGGGIPNPNCGW